MKQRMNHSCQPNAYVHAQRRDLLVRALAPIAAGTPITRAYVPPFASRSVRQMALSQRWGFNCLCQPACRFKGMPLNMSDRRRMKIEMFESTFLNQEREETADEWAEIIKKGGSARC